MVASATMEPGSGLATLHIRIGEGADDIVLLHGDHRMIHHLAVHLDGEQVEIVEDSDGLSVRHILFEGGIP